MREASFNLDQLSVAAMMCRCYGSLRPRHKLRAPLGMVGSERDACQEIDSAMALAMRGSLRYPTMEWGFS